MGHFPLRPKKWSADVRPDGWRNPPPVTGEDGGEGDGPGRASGIVVRWARSGKQMDLDEEEGDVGGVWGAADVIGTAKPR